MDVPQALGGLLMHPTRRIFSLQQMESHGTPWCFLFFSMHERGFPPLWFYVGNIVSEFPSTYVQLSAYCLDSQLPTPGPSSSFAATEQYMFVMHTHT